MNHIVVAGPQASGKSTLKKYLGESLKNKYKYFEVVVFDEIRKLSQSKYNLMGALTVKKSFEYAIIEEDMERLKDFEERRNEGIIFIDETSIFTLAHAITQKMDIDKYFRFYEQRLKNLNSKIIFLDVVPSVSWSRRKQEYEGRLKSLSEKERIKD